MYLCATVGKKREKINFQQYCHFQEFFGHNLAVIFWKTYLCLINSDFRRVNFEVKKEILETYFVEQNTLTGLRIDPNIKNM